MPDQAAQTANIWSDPNLMSIMLGMIGQAAMGQYGQQTWQSQLGGAATALGRSRKTALAAEEMGGKREEREAEWMSIIRSLIGGGEAEPETPYGGPEAASAFGLGLGAPGPAPTGRGPVTRTPQLEGIDLFEGYGTPHRKEPNVLDLYLGGV